MVSKTQELAIFTIYLQVYTFLDKNISSLEDEEEVKLETSVQNSSSQSTTDDHSKQDQIEEDNSIVTEMKSHSSENTVT